MTLSPNLVRKNAILVFAITSIAILILLVPVAPIKTALGQNATEGQLPSTMGSRIPENTTAGTVEEQQPQLTRTIIGDLARQATVQIHNLFSSGATAPSWTLDEERMAQDISSLVQAGSIDPNNPQEVSAAQAILFISEPLQYMVETNELKTAQAIAYSVGSGFIVTPQGHIVTNAHVVAPPTISVDEREAITGQLISSAAIDFAIADMEQISQITGLDIQANFQSEQQLMDMLSQIQDFYSTRTVIDPERISQDIFIEGIAIPEPTNPELPGIEARPFGNFLGFPIPGRDAAIIKVDIGGEIGQNLPTLPLAEVDTLDTVDEIVIVGFPAAIVQDFAEETTGRNPVAVLASVGGRQQFAASETPEGTAWEAIQIGASLSGGISGGPALDSSGNVIGIATFSIIDDETGLPVPGFGFLVPAAIIQEFLSIANIQPQESTFTTMYRDALLSFHSGNNEEALNILRQLDADFPDNPDIDRYMARAGG